MLRKTLICSLFGFLSLTCLSLAYASNIIVPVQLFTENGQNKDIGTITLESSPCGVLITPNLYDLPPGIHGFHIHVKPTCAEHGMAAGGHFDPAKTDEHHGPYQHKGHLGDMPVLIVNADGRATLPTLAPRFKLTDVSHHALMIHAGGDNYSDQPEKLGGGGERIACGVIP